MLVATLGAIVRREVRRCVAAAARNIAVAAAGALFVAVAAVAAVVAAYQALLTVWPPYWAAAAIAGGALVLAGIAFAILAGGGRSRKPDPGAQGRGEADLETIMAALKGDTSRLTRSALDEAEARYRRDPATALAAAAVLGVVAGILWPDGPESEG